LIEIAQIEAGAKVRATPGKNGEFHPGSFLRGKRDQ
jgi:hypothetical protein